MCPDPHRPDALALTARIRELEAQLEESEETLGAIRRGEIDALVMRGQKDERRVYTLESADRPYRVLIEQMQEGAVTLGEDGTELYCNRRLAALLNAPQERVIGQPLISFQAAFGRQLGPQPTQGESARPTTREQSVVMLARDRPRLVPAHLTRREPMLSVGLLTFFCLCKALTRQFAQARAGEPVACEPR